MATGVLDPELETFEKHRDELLRTAREKFALVKDQEVVGTYDTEQAAISEGYHRFGNVPFLVKQILEADRQMNFMSGIIPQ